ncbi:hypothetical protein [uncultured Aquimarina sp.]|uniref:hypothetical protein n=1 Tax=uncultured Aquimarina sp. TaxID=575652 RepID=UPI002625CECA|nr:hypothetical protein [uncultured Aquimarina sp.]
MKSIQLTLFMLLSISVTYAQLPPKNPFLIDSPFSAVHNGSYRQGNSSLPGLNSNDEITVSFASTPRNKVSPWLLYSESYPDGSHTIWGSTSTHIFKAISTETEFRVISKYRIDYNPMINDLSWSLLLLENHQVLTYDDNKLYVFGEKDNTDPRSEIILIKTIELPKNISSVSKLCRLYDGTIAFASSKGLIGILDSNDFSIKTTYQIPLERKEKAYHNDYAADENGNIFISTTKKMLCVQWNGTTITPKWEVSMDFGGNRFQGIGTTPTLLGSGTHDKLVCVVDSKKPARMLTFWRDNIPIDWKGIKGENKRVAAITDLPGAMVPNKINTAVENSPTAYGYEIVCAQYNGFLGQSCKNKKGVYKLKWYEKNNTMKIVWHRYDINLNNVITYSIASNMIYGSGREADCNYYYYALDWETGKTVKKFNLGDNKKYDDPGNANIIGPDRSIIFNSKKGLVRLRPR